MALACKWAGESEGKIELKRALAVVTSEPARVLGAAPGTPHASAGRLVEGGSADICVFDPTTQWTVEPSALRSQGKHTPFSGYQLTGRVRHTLVGGQLAYSLKSGD